MRMDLQQRSPALLLSLGLHGILLAVLLLFTLTSAPPVLPAYEVVWEKKSVVASQLSSPPPSLPSPHSSLSSPHSSLSSPPSRLSSSRRRGSSPHSSVTQTVQSKKTKISSLGRRPHLREDRTLREDDNQECGDNREIVNNQTVVSQRQPYTPLPPYPWVCRKRQQEGTVILSVKLTSDGRVAEAHLDTSSGYSLLDDAALAGVKGWILEEGDAQRVITIAFRLTGESMSIS